MVRRNSRVKKANELGKPKKVNKKLGKSDKSGKADKAGKPGRIKTFFMRKKKDLKEKRAKRVILHKSFRRSYREDYKRELEVPGIIHHIFLSFKLIFKNWKLFLPLIILSIVLSVTFVGLMSEATYRQFQNVLDQTSEQMGTGDIGNVAKAALLLVSTITTGGLSGESSEAAMVFAVLIFLIIWLTTIFILRHRLAGHKIKLRDALYNAMTPLVSTFLVFVVALIQCIPLFIMVVVHSAAVQTEFLSTPFYALVFFIFAALMVLLSGYLLSSSLIAFVAVSAPGLYPMRALDTASDLMAGRRVRFILRLIALLFALAVMWVIVMLPLITFDLVMKNFEWTEGIPFVPICLLVMTCFTGVYITTYMYLYYRFMLGYDTRDIKDEKK